MTLDRFRTTTRTLRKHPGFSIVVILSLALAIALNTTMYSVLDALVHPRVDIKDPSTLVRVTFFGDYRGRASYAERDSLLLAGAPSIIGVARSSMMYGANSAFIVGDRYTEAAIDAVDTNYFRVLGARFVAGRGFIGSDVNASPQPIVITERMVGALFPPGTDPIGAPVKVLDRSFVVVGVLSRYSVFRADFAGGFTLLTPDHPGMYRRILRVRPGTSDAEIWRELQTVAARIALVAGESPRDVAFRVARPDQSDVNLRAFDYAVMLSVVAVLLVACANVANMQLARGIARARELAVRAALGATRRRLIEHLLSESVVLAAAGLALGLVLTVIGAGALHAAIPPAVGSYIVDPQLSWRVLVFAVGATMLCILLVGLAPAIRVSRVDPNELLKAGTGTGASRRHRRAYGYLVIVEIALTLGLLSGASVMIRGALRMNASFAGFDAMHLAVGYYAPPLNVGATVARSALFADAVERYRTLPHVVAVAADVGGSFDRGVVSIGDSTAVREVTAPGYGFRYVSPSFFRTFGLPIVAGRDFMEGERDHAAVVIDEYTAKKFWPNADPIGGLIKFGDARSTRPFVRIVGVVGTLGPDGRPKPFNLADWNNPTIGQIYYLPGPEDSVVVGKSLAATVTVRVAGNPAAIVPLLRSNGLIRPRTMDDELGITSQRESRRFLAEMFTLFAALGLGLAAFGVYGVVAHSVAERRRELGVRIALGATARDILHAVLRESVAIALAGIALGLLGTKYGVMMLTQFAAADDVYNAALYAGVAMFLFAAAGTSAFVPALRATRVDPTESLRSE